MRKIAIVLAGGVAFVAVTPALAQDNTTFTGPRVEAIVGYDISKAGSDVDDDVNSNNDESVEGLLYGVGIGYDMAVGKAVVGVEGEFTDGTGDTNSDDGDFEGFGLGSVETGRDLYVGARAGMLVSPKTLLYVKGGYTNARYNVVATDGTSEFRENVDTDGWRLGAGGEMALNDKVFAKLEYRYSKYSEAEVDFEDEGVPDTDRFDIDTDRHQIVAGVGMRF